MLPHKCSSLLLVATMLSSLLSLSIHAQEIDIASAKKAIETGAVIIDVRTDWEWSAGHHPDALHMQNTQLLEKITQAGIAKDQTIVLYCRSGKRAKQSTLDLQAAGFTNVINAGGFKDISPKSDSQ